jgi:hypothetical protein
MWLHSAPESAMRRPAHHRLATVVVALSAVVATGAASAQSYYDPYRDRNYDGYARDGYGQPYPDRYGNSGGAVYDYARVLRVDPVIDSRYGYGGYPASGQQNCHYRETNTYAAAIRTTRAATATILMRAGTPRARRSPP